MFGSLVSALGNRQSWIAGGLVAGLVTATLAGAQQPASAAPAQQAAAAPTGRTFSPDAGMILNFIKPDKTADFEAVLAKVKEGLTKSTKPERNAQAKSWKVFKQPVEPGAPAGDVLYVFVIDPAVKDADYTISNILAESFPPAEVNALFEKYSGAYGRGQQPVNLALVNDFSK